MGNKKFLDIDNCIIINDVKQISKSPAGKKIKTKRQLSKKIVKDKLLPGTEVSIYTKLSRAEKDGFKTEDKELVNAILEILEVSKKELIKEL